MYTPAKSKRPIPVNWHIGNMSDLFTICNGKDHSKLLTGPNPVYGSGGVMRYVDGSLYSGESVLIPRKGTLNNIIYVNNTFWTVDTMFFTKMKAPNSAIYTYFTVKLYDYNKLNMGTGVPSMTASLVYSLSAVIPDQKILDQFNNLVKPLFDGIKRNNVENSKLCSLRNWLLPLLMSGQAALAD
ncbi:MAG: restriction endonuclease subunit S [Eubacterium sp.]|nr:restriction endonuclease subunit S [Eubacterium sp.]